jgi:predicted deacylase
VGQKTDEIKTYSFTSGVGGIQLIVFGAIHGNEVCGPIAIEEIMKLLTSKEIELLSGQVTFVPICNPQAYREGKRLIDENLNRIFIPTDNPQSYEAGLANLLCPLVEAADVLLDVHSFDAVGPTNIFLDFPTLENRAHVEALDFEYALVNWPELYEINPYFNSYDTTRYANSVGKQGVLVECGQHNDPDSVVVAKEAILKTLEHLNMINKRSLSNLCPKPQLHSINMTYLGTKEAEDDYFLDEWKHLQRVPAGTQLAKRASGEVLSVDVDSIILLPKHTAKLGEEWFYVGLEV